MQKQLLVLFILGLCFFGGVNHSESQTCRDAAGGVIPCPATEAPAAPPDRDGDGMPDAQDLCPDAGGPAQNTGCPETSTTTTTSTVEAPATVPQAVLPSTGACVMATIGAEPVNRRAIPSASTQGGGLQGAILSVIQPNEIFPINFALITSEGTWYNTNPNSWVAAAVVRLGGDCARIPTVQRGTGQILSDFSGWTSYDCNPAENPACGTTRRAGLMTSVQYPYRVQAGETQHPIYFLLFAKPDGGIGLMLSNVMPGTFPHPDDENDNPSPFLFDFDLVNYDPVIDPPAPDLPKFVLSIDDSPDDGIIIGIPNDNPGDPGFEPTFDFSNIDDDDIDLFGEVILKNPPMEEGCDLYAGSTYYHTIANQGNTYQAYLGSVNGYTMLPDSTVTAWIDGYGLDYSTDSVLTITKSFLENQESVMSSSGSGSFFDLTIIELNNYLTTFDVTVSSYFGGQSNKLRLNICLIYP